MSEKKIIFTICARNYYGLAQVLKRSILQHHDDVEFLVFVADGIPEQDKAQFGTDAIDCTQVMKQYVSSDKLADLAFKYNLTEFCTALKPFCFRHVFDTMSNPVAVYLDPDIFVFSPLEPIFSALETASIILTPHIIYPSITEGKRSDKGIMATGIFNLGFLGLRKSPVSEVFTKWWGERLLDQCFVDNHDALFTDQKWMDFVPALFPADQVCILRHAGTNVAPWNFHERRFTPDQNGRFQVQRRVSAQEQWGVAVEPPQALVFVHFSGFDYKKLCNGEVAQYNIDGLELDADVNALIAAYISAIQAQRDNLLRFMQMNYAYGAYQNGKAVSSFHRRLYRSATQAGIRYSAPFSTAKGSLYDMLDKQQLLIKGANPAQLDKVNKGNIPGMQKKLVLFNKLMRLLKRVIGLNNYLLLLRLMRPYSRPESQLHLLHPDKNVI